MTFFILPAHTGTCVKPRLRHGKTRVRIGRGGEREREVEWTGNLEIRKGEVSDRKETGMAIF